MDFLIITIIFTIVIAGAGLIILLWNAYRTIAGTKNKTSTEEVTSLGITVLIMSVLWFLAGLTVYVNCICDAEELQEENIEIVRFLSQYDKHNYDISQEDKIISAIKSDPQFNDNIIIQNYIETYYKNLDKIQNLRN